MVLFVLVASVFLQTSPSSAQSRLVPNVLDNFSGRLSPCVDICKAPRVTANEFDSCGVVAVQALSDIARKTSEYTIYTFWYRVVVGGLFIGASVLMLLLLGVLLSKWRNYDLKVLISASIVLAVIVAGAGWWSESVVLSQAGSNLLGADQELRMLTNLGVIPSENAAGGTNCYLQRVIQDYGKTNQGTRTADALKYYPGVFTQFSSLAPGTPNLQGEIENRADDILDFLGRQNVALSPSSEPSTPDDALSQNGHLRAAAEEVMGPVRFTRLLWLGVACASLLLAWGAALGHSAFRRRRHKLVLRNA
jgi:hypothetical protein